MNGEGEPHLLKPAEKKRKTKGSAIKEDAWAGVDRALFEVLRALRKELAAERSVPPYVVFGDKSLRDMARQKPASHEAFLHITGVGERKDEQYGEPFLHAIDCYLEEHGPAGAPAAVAPTKKKKTRTDDVAFNLFRGDASIDDVRSRTGRAESTVVKYLIDFLRAENRTSPEPWVDESVFERVSSAPAHLRDGRLRDLVEYFDGEILDDQISICLACLANAE
jgi:ATP-dependent DNA helicase RecQ